jgi:hypothetical protein
MRTVVGLADRAQLCPYAGHADAKVLNARRPMYGLPCIAGGEIGHGPRRLAPATLGVNSQST